MHKKLTFACFILATWSSLHAQTNTFPTSGNVGIGTTSPGYSLTMFGSGLIGYSAATADVKLNFGKPPLLQFTGDGTVNNGPGIALLQVNIGGVDTGQSASELSLAATRGASAASRLAVQNGDFLGQIGWFGDDGTDVRTRGVAIQSTVDTSLNTVSSQIIPANLAIGTIAAAPIIFYTNAGNGVAGAFRGGGWRLVTAPNERMRITGAGYIGIGTANPNSNLEILKGSASSTGPVLTLNNPSGGAGAGGGINFYSSAQTQPIQAQIISSDDGAYSANIIFSTKALSNAGALGEKMRLTSIGNLGIGTTNPGSYKLAVNGTIRAKEVIVDTGWSDYVFSPDYKLTPLSEVETHIKENGHLPGIPSAKEVAEHGVSMGEIQAKLLAKIEELTLHVIEQEKHQREQDDRIERLETENKALRMR